MIAQLNTSILNLLSQIETAVMGLSDQQYSSSIALLGGSSIGQHIRHIIECYIELGNGYENGTVNYDGRKRDLVLETCRSAAIGKLREISSLINLENKSLFLTCEQMAEQTGHTKLTTNYDRELLYNLEHTVHHMALIRVGIGLTSVLQLPENFGVAASTISYRKTCAR